MIDKREQILSALGAFIRQRPGLEFGNYGDVTAYRSEMRGITRDMHVANKLLAAVAWRTSSIDEQVLRDSFRAYSGRLSIVDRADGSIGLEYCAGQYYPTEYRKAACAVLAAALWSAARADMPAPVGKVTRVSGVGPFAVESEHDSIDGLSPGDWLRRHFRREFGANIQRHWFD